MLRLTIEKSNFLESSEDWRALGAAFEEHPSLLAPALLYITNHFRQSRAQSHHNHQPAMIKQVKNKNWARLSP